MNPFSIDEYGAIIASSTISEFHRTLSSPCKFFLTATGCWYGDQCRFSHNPNEIIQSYGLHQCPTLGCINLCRGKQCRDCHFQMHFLVPRGAPIMAVESQESVVQASNDIDIAQQFEQTVSSEMQPPLPSIYGLRCLNADCTGTNPQLLQSSTNYIDCGLFEYHLPREETQMPIATIQSDSNNNNTNEISTVVSKTTPSKVDKADKVDRPVVGQLDPKASASKPCRGKNCKELTLKRLCQECFDTEKQFVRPTRGFIALDR